MVGKDVTGRGYGLV